AAAADGDFRLARLVAGVARGDGFTEVSLDASAGIDQLDVFVLGVDVADDAGEPVGFGGAEDHDGGKARAEGQQNVPYLEGGDVEDDGGGNDENDRRAEVADADGQGDDAEGERGRQQRVPVIHGALAERDEVSEEDDQGRLGELGGL